MSKTKRLMSKKNSFFTKKTSLNINNRLYSLEEPRIMGIINITPDSFYDGGRYTQSSDILKRAEEHLSQGADILDIGACSSRPGAKTVSVKEEIKRLKTALEIIKKNFPEAILSVDTYHSQVAEFAITNYGIEIINDISSGKIDQQMFNTIAKYNPVYIIMHMKGTPENMQISPQYKDLVKDIFLWFSDKLLQLKKLGINDIIIDPGFGFGKTLDDNYKLLNKLNEFKIFGLPVMVGISRKSMIYKLLDSDADQALNGTTVLNTIALMKGASILRVHDVKEAREAITLYIKMKKN